MVDAKRTTGVDVKRTMQTASMDVAMGGERPSAKRRERAR